MKNSVLLTLFDILGYCEWINDPSYTLQDKVNVLRRLNQICEANELESSQKWLGVSLCDSVETHYGKLLPDSPYITRFLVPVEDGCQERWVLDWPTVSKSLPQWAWDYLCSEKDITFLKDRSPKECQKRYESTLAFYSKRFTSPLPSAGEGRDNR
ncbi:MAG: hypothetical protein HYS22_07830 [Deltaproteobacteria bacterium]|nr:hypothetical protein [Deltaproteobacteria bacterium]